MGITSFLIVIAILSFAYLSFLVRSWVNKIAPFNQDIPSPAFELKVHTNFLKGKFTGAPVIPRFTFITERFSYFLGKQGAALVSDPKVFLSLMTASDQESFLSLLRDSAKAHQDFYWEGVLICRGEARQVAIDAKIKPIKPDGIYFQGVITDLTPLKNALSDNAALEKETLKILRELPIPHMWTSLNRDGETLFVNSKFTEVFGYRQADLPTILDWFRLVYPNLRYRDQVLSWWNEILPKAIGQNLDLSPRETRVSTKSGQILDVMISATVVQGSLCLSFLDLTQRKLSEGLALSLTENIPMGTYVMEVNAVGRMRFTFLSKRFLQMFDMVKEAALADPNIAFSRIHPDDYSNFIHSYLESIKEKRSFYWEGRVLIRGLTRWFEFEAIPKNLSGGLILLEGVVADITDKKEVERQNIEQAIEINATQQELVRLKEIEELNASLKATIKEKNRLLKSMTTAFKANSMGNMMRSIAHEINNPLGAISLTTELLQLELEALKIDNAPPQLDHCSELVSSILADSQRAGGVVARLRKLFVYGEEAFQEFDLSATINDVCQLLAKELHEHEIVLEKNIPNGYRLKGDSGQIQMVILNAVNNAIDALQQLPQMRRLNINLQAKGDEIILEFLDNGPGFPDDFLKKGLGLFHTTKKGGMGVGLWLSKTILENHGGKLIIGNQKVGGARSAMYFSLQEKPANLELFERNI